MQQQQYQQQQIFNLPQPTVGYQQPQPYQQVPFQQPSYGNYQVSPNMVFQHPSPSIKALRLLKEKDNTKKIAAIIVSFCNGSSYDDLFTRV